MSEDPISVDELAEKADEYLHETSLTPEEYEVLKQSVAELTAIFSAERSYFVLGSYGRPEIRRLQLVKDRLNRQPDAYAFLMVDVRSEWTNTYLKFRLLADYTDVIVGVAEHAQGGFLVERGTSQPSSSTSRRRTCSNASTTRWIQMRSTRESTSPTRIAECRRQSSRCSTILDVLSVDD